MTATNHTTYRNLAAKLRDGRVELTQNLIKGAGEFHYAIVYDPISKKNITYEVYGNITKDIKEYFNI